MKISLVKTTSHAASVIEFLLKQFEPNNLDEGEKADIARDLTDSLTNPHNSYLQAINDQRVVGAIGVHENYVGNGGYEIGWLAVSKQERRQGVASKLLVTAENLIRKNNGRYLVIDTGSTEIFKEARAFYEKNGYRQVGRIPDYYGEGIDKIDYYKRLRIN